MGARALRCRHIKNSGPAILSFGPLRFCRLVKGLIDGSRIECLIKLLGIDFFFLGRRICLGPDHRSLCIIEMLFLILHRTILWLNQQLCRTVGQFARIVELIGQSIGIQCLLCPAIAVRSLGPDLNLRRHRPMSRQHRVGHHNRLRIEIFAIIVIRTQPVPARLLGCSRQNGLPGQQPEHQHTKAQPMNDLLLHYNSPRIVIP